jgi:hypothetical protein
MSSKQVVAAISVVALLVILVYPALSTGNVSLALKANRIPNADHVYIKVKSVWVHQAGQSSDQGWELIFNSSLTIDLMTLVNDSQLIKGIAPVANYDSMRFDVSNVTWTYHGTSTPIQLESTQLIAHIDFRVTASRDIPLSVVVTGRSDVLQGQTFFLATLVATLS